MTIKIEIVTSHKSGKKTTKTHSYTCPGSYSDFKIKHLNALAEYQNNPSDITFLLFLTNLMGIPPRIANLLDSEQVFWAEVRYKAGDPELVFIPELSYLDTPFSLECSILPRIGILFGPKTRLNNFSLERVGYCNHYAEEYDRDSENVKSNLNSFIAHAYKLPFLPYSHKLSWITKSFCFLLRTTTKKAALRNYAGLTHFYSELYPTIFVKEKDDSSQSFGLAGIIRRLAQTNIHGDEKKCRTILYPDAMLTFAMLAQDAIESNKKSITIRS
jgi:hypothetical protein